MSDEWIEQSKTIKQLRRKCPGLTATDLNVWIRNKALIEETDFQNVLRDGNIVATHLYHPHSFPKIRRLYHYHKIRRFDRERYKALANQTEPLAVFALLLERDFCSRDQDPILFPAHTVFPVLPMSLLDILPAVLEGFSFRD